MTATDPTSTAQLRVGAEHAHGAEPGGQLAGLQAVLRSLPGDPKGHEWVEVSAFAGRFCARCGVDEDDQDDIRWDLCCPEAAHVD